MSKRYAFWRLLAPTVVLCLLLSPLASNSRGADKNGTAPLEPEVAQASDEPAAAMAAISTAEGWKIDLFAAEPLVANIVTFDIDHRGRLFVCESYRQNRGVTDNRGHDEQWLLADLAAQTVQDRIDYHKRLLGEAAITYAQHDDRIRRVSDTDGDGVADESTVFANGFNHLEEGTGAGILVRGSDVLYTCIPKLWKLTDENDDGVSDQRAALSDGYGVRVAFRGHDLHGLTMGPDGRVYFSIGDRGYHITTPDGRILADPASGAVFRCELDGSGLEVFATGLRNPQELAFNDLGDLFSVDNNSDSGDKARIVHILQDGDTGWRMYYQYLPDRGPFNREHIWEPLSDEQPAYIVPPIENFTDGPSGFAYYPGTGFGDQLKNKFLICDFRGGPSNSGIRSFELDPNGATYKLGANDQPIWTCLATDLAFGPDGALYVSDWVDGWDGLGKGRIYRVTDPQHADTDLIADVQSKLASDWTQRAIADLTSDLKHADRRVRSEAQWELARRGELDSLAKVATDTKASSTARLHATWGIGQIVRTDADNLASALDAIRPLLKDSDSNVAASVAQIAGEAGDKKSVDLLKPLATGKETSPRLRYFAIRALGKLADASILESVVSLAAANKNADYAIRHAAITYLASAVKADQIAALSKHSDANVRRTAVVALRRLRSRQISAFLNDTDPLVVAEAVRAIHDASIQGAFPELAGMIKKSDSPAMKNPEAVRRILNANYRLGTPSAAEAIASFAAGGDHDPAMRLEALEMLSSWATPDPRDRVLGRYDPLDARPKTDAAKALEPQIEVLMISPAKIRDKTTEVAAELEIKKIATALEQEIASGNKPVESKAVSLRALARLNPAAAVKLARKIELSPATPLSTAALSVLAQHDKEASFAKIAEATKSSDTAIRQLAWDILAKIKSPEADKLLAGALDDYITAKMPADTRLNWVQAASGRLDAELTAKLAAHQQNVAESDPLGKWLDALEGGDIDNGNRLFFGKTELSCVRCHKVDRAGGEVGPNLTVIGKQRDRRYLLESICLPNAQVAKGFETAMVVDIDGKVTSGIVKTETDDYLELTLADGSQVRIAQDDIEARKKGNSSMPADLTKYMTERELRDIVAYLATLKVDPRAASDVE
ncbi:PVC-type heme-binding CxxCH protein [Stieleria varia]|uniref:Cytochrome c n=1 Tax=Stieleria varia TaxID=2528005 RepID=A0A5C6B7D0_9BACT|nr:PVC-type heme-binding CxxCH protein [Stieleria varia]TWU07502.1 Cytochrome c [Stieleria varia]